MEKKEIKLGDLKVVRSDLGLDFYPPGFGGQDGIWLNEKGVKALKELLDEENEIPKEKFKNLEISEKNGVVILSPKWVSKTEKSKQEVSIDLELDVETVDKLRNWLNKYYKQIDYKNKSYIDKRKILRQLSIKDEIDCFLDIVTDDMVDKIRNFSRIGEVKHIIDIDTIDFWNKVRNFLIDGYLAFEIIYKDDKPIDLSELDIVTLIIEIKDGKITWIQNSENKNMKRVLLDTQIIYMSYSEHDSKTSYVEELKESYERLKILESHLFFPKDDPRMIDLRINNESIRLLNQCLNRVSRIPEEMINNGIKTENLRYQRFINKLVSIFIEKLFNRLIELNK